MAGDINKKFSGDFWPSARKVPFFKRLKFAHEKLEQRYQWYANWHRGPYFTKAHFGSLALYFIILTLVIAHSASALTTERASIGQETAAYSVTLAAKDDSGVFDAKSGEKELISERTETFKKFDLGNGKIRIAGQESPIHYKKDPFSTTEQFKEIDLTIRQNPTKAEGRDYDYYIERNGYQSYFTNSRDNNGEQVNYVAQFKRAGQSLEMAPVELIYENAAGERQIISQPIPGITPDIDNNNYTLTYKDAFGPGIDFRYNVGTDKFFKTVIVNSKDALPTPTINTDGLKLTVIMAVSWDETVAASNDFAKDIKTNDIKPSTVETKKQEENIPDPKDETKTIKNEKVVAPAVDESVQADSQIAYQDQKDRNVWWLQPAKAWDSAQTPNSWDAGQTLKRSGSNILDEIAIPVDQLNDPNTKYPFFLDTAISEIQVAASADDAQNYGTTYPGDGMYSASGTSINMGGVGGFPMGATFYIAGFRFLSVPIPKSATIDAASISYKASSALSNPAGIYVAAEDADSAATFATTTHEPYDAYVAHTTAAVDWSIVSSWTSGTWYGGAGQTDAAELKSVVQEITDRAGWASGQNLVFVSWNKANPPQSYTTPLRQVYSYDQSGNVSGPKFNATYTLPSTPCYWVGVSNPDVWNNAANWSSSSGGSGSTCRGGANIPDATTAVIFDGANNNSINVDVDASAYSITAAASGYSGTFDATTHSITLGGDLTFGSGTLSMGSNTWTVAGNATFTSLGTLNGNTSTLKMTGTTMNLIGAAQTLNNLQISGTITATTSDVTVAGVLTIDNTKTFDAGSRTITLSGTGTPFVKTGTFTPSTSTIAYTGGTTATNITSATYNNLTLNHASTTYTAAGDITASGVFTITAGTFDASNRIITLSGSTGTPFVITDTFTYSASTIAYTGNAAGNTAVVPTTYYNLTLNNSGEIFGAASSFDVTNTFTITAGTFAPVATAVISGAGTLTGSGTAQVSRTAATADFLSQYMITNKTYTNLTIEYIGSSAQTVSTVAYGSLKISTTAAAVATMAANTTVSGVLTISAGGTLDASSYTITLSGSTTPFVATGTFTYNTSTVKYTGASATNVGSATYYNLYIDHAAVIFTAAGNITVTNVFTINAGTFDASTRTITLSGSGTPFVKTGTFTYSSSTISYTGSSATDVTAATYYNLYINHAAVTFTAAGNITTFSVFTINAGTFDASNKTITLEGITGIPFVNSGTFTASASTVAYNGNYFIGNTTVVPTTYYNLTLNNGGEIFGAASSFAVSNTFSITAGTFAPVAGTVISGAGTLTGSGTAWVTRIAATPDFLSQYTITNKTYTNLTIEYMAASAQTVSTVAYNNLKISNTVAATMADDTTVSGVLTISAGGILDGSTRTITLSGAGTPFVKTGIFVYSTSTIKYTGATATNVASTTYYNLYIDHAAVTFTAAGAITATNILTINTGTFNASSYIITLSGSTTPFVISGTFTPATSTISYTGAGATNVTSTTYNNLIINHAAVTFTAAGDITVSSVFTITAGTFDASSRTITLSGTGTPFVATGTFTPSTGTISYTGGTTATNVTSTTYNNLILNHASTTYTAAGDITVSSVFTITAGTFNASSRTITLSGSTTPFVVSGTFTPATSTVTYTGAGATDVTSTTYNNLTINHAAVTFTAAGDITVTSVFTITAGIFDASNRTITLSGGGIPFVKTGTLTASASTFAYTSPLATTITAADYYHLDLIDPPVEKELSPSENPALNVFSQAPALISMVNNILNIPESAIEGSTTLVNKDTSGAYTQQQNEFELVNERTKSFKKFQQADGKIRVAGDTAPIHYKIDPYSTTEQYKEIDLSIKENTSKTTNNSFDWSIDKNGYQVKIWNSEKIKDEDINYSAEFQRAGQDLRMAPTALVYENASGQYQEISKPISNITPEIDNNAYTITWKNAFGPGIDFRYNLSPDKFFKTVIINDKSDLPPATIGSDGLKLTIVMSTAWSDVSSKDGFSKESKNNDLSVNYDPSKEEVVNNNPSQFSFTDSQNHDLWWLQKPMAWDGSENTNFFPMDWSLVQSDQNNFMKLSSNLSDINNSKVSFPFYMDTAITEIQVAASADDAQNNGATHPGDGNYVSNGATQNIGAIGIMPGASSFYIDGFRFLSVPIPQGATIDAASISYKTSATATTATEVYVAAEDTNSAVTFAANTHEPYDSYVARTTAVVDWNIGTTSWTANSWYGGAGQTSAAELKDVVKEVTDLAGWASGQNMAFVLWNKATSCVPYTSYFRTVYTYDQTGNVSGPKFNATYTPQGPPTYTLAAGTFNVAGNLTIGNGTDVMTVDADTNDPIVNVDGNMSITANAIFIASATAAFSVASNFTTSATGVFTDSGGTLTFDGQGLQTITAGGTDASHDFQNLTVTNNDSTNGVSFADSATVNGTFTDVTASSKLTFHSTSTYAFNTLNINGQATGTRIVLTSSTGSSAWNFTITQASPAASNVDVKDSNANKDIDATTGGYDSGGNTHWLFPSVVFEISGTCKQYDQSTACTSGETVKVAVDGVLDAVNTGTTAVTTGDWTISGATVTSGQVVTIFIDGVVDANEAGAVTKYDGTGSVTGVNLYERHLSIGSADNQTITNGDLGQYDHSVSGDNENIFWDVDNTTNDLTVPVAGTQTATDQEVIIKASNIYRPDSVSSGNVTTPNLEIPTGATLTADGNTITLTASTTPLVIAGTFSEGTSTVAYTGSSATNVTGTTYSNLYINHAGVTFTSAGSTTVSAVFTINAGTFDASNITIILSGSTTPFVVTDTFTPSTSTISYTGSSATNVTATTYNNLTLNHTGTTFTAAGDIIVGGDLVATAGTFAGTNDITVDGGDVTGNGTINLTGGGFILKGDGNFGGTTNWTFYILSFGAPFDATTTTKTSTNQITVSDALVLFPGHTLNASNATWVLSGSGNVFAENGTFNCDTSTFRYTGSTATNVDSTTYYNLNLDYTGTTFTAAGDITVSSVFTITAGTFDASSRTIILSGTGTPFVATGTFTPSTSTVSYTGGTTATNVTSTTYNNLILNHASTTYTAAGDITVSSVFTITAGTFNASSRTITLSGSTTPFVVSGTFTPATSTISYTGAGATDVTSTTYNNLTINHAAVTFTAAGDITVSSVFTITAGTFDASSRTITLSGTGTSFVATGTFTYNTSTVKYTGVGATTITATNYYNLETSLAADAVAGWVVSGAGTTAANGTYTWDGSTYMYGKPYYTYSSYSLYWDGLSWDIMGASLLYVSDEVANLPANPWFKVYGDAPAPTVASANTYTLATGASQTLNVYGAYTNGDGTHGVTLDATTNDPTLNIDGAFTNSANATFVASDSASFSVAGNFTNNASATFTHSSGTLTLDGGSTQSITTSGDALNNVTVANTAGEVSEADASTIAGILTVNASAIYDINGQNITLATLTNNGTFRLQGGETTVTITSKDTTHGTIEYDGTGNYTGLKYGNTYFGLKINKSGGAGTVIINAALDVNGAFTLANGTLDLDTNDPTVNIAGNITLSGGSITKSSTNALVTFDGDLSYTDSVGTMNFGDIQVGHSPDTTTLGSNMVCDSLNIDAGDTLATAGYDIDCGGTISIEATATLNATSGAGGDSLINLTGNWSNAGTFTASTSTVTLDGTAALQTVTAGGVGAGYDFNNLTVTNSHADGVSFADAFTASGIFTDTTASSKLTFHAGSTYTIAAISISGGAGTRIVMVSSTPTSHWNFNVAGSPVASYVNVTDSDATAGSEINATTGSYDNGNNHHWLFVSGITISGICKQYDQSTACTSGETVKVAVDSTLQAQTGTTAVTTGDWTITGVAIISGQVVTIFVDGVADANEAGAVTKYDGTGNIAGVILYEEHLTVGSDDNQTITNADIGQYDNSVSADEDIFWDVDANNDLVVDALAQSAQEELYIKASNTFRPDSASSGNVTTFNFEIPTNAIFTADDNTITIEGTGTPFTVTGTFSEGTSTVAYTGASATNVTGTTYSNLYINHAAVTFTSAGSTTVSGVFTINAGTFDASNITIILSGSTTPFVVTGTFTCSTSTIKYTGTSATNVTATTYYNLTFDGGGTFTLGAALQVNAVLTLTTGTFTTSGTNYGITIGTSATTTGAYSQTNGVFTANASAITCYGNYAVTGGTYTAGTSTLTLDATPGDLSLNTNGYTLYNVLFYNNSSATARTATLGSASSQTLSFGGYFYVSAANTKNMTVTAVTNNPAVNITGLLDYTGGGTGTESISLGNGTWTVSDNIDFANGSITAGSSTLKMNGTSKSINGYMVQLNNFTVSGTISKTGDFTINGTLTVDLGKTYTIAGTQNMGVGAVVTVNGTIDGAGILKLVNSGASNLSTGGTLSCVVRFDAVSSNTVVVARTYGGDVQVYSGSGTNRTSTFGSAPGQTINFSNLYIVANAGGNMTADANVYNPTINITGNLDYTGTGAGTEIILMGSGTWTVSGDVDFTNGTVTCGTSTLVMNGTSKNLLGAGQTLYKLTVSGTVSLLTSDVLVSNTLTVGDTKTLTINTPRTLTVLTGATTTLTGSGTITGTGTLTLNDSAGALLGTGGTLSTLVKFDATAGDVTVPQRTYGSGVTFYSNSSASARTVTLGTAGSQTLNFSSNFNVFAANSQNITATAATWNPTINITGDFGFNALSTGVPSFTSTSGTLTISGSWSDIGGTFTHSSGTIDFNNTTDKTFTSDGSQTYNNITHSGSGKLSFSSTYSGSLLGWQYRRPITIDRTKVPDVADPSTTYANFPVLIALTGLSNINADGSDIRFTASDGTTLLPREIESYSAGTLVAWVKVTLTKDAGDASNDTMYMYYGNPSVTEPVPSSTYGSQNVWTNYAGVWHMGEASWTVGQPSVLDSSSNAKNLTVTGTGVNSFSGALIGRGGDLTPSDAGQLQNLSIGPASPNDYTVETWLYFPSSISGKMHMGLLWTHIGLWDWNGVGFVQHWPNGVNVRFGYQGTYGLVSNPTTPAWHHFAVSVNGAGNEARYYVDGVLKATKTPTSGTLWGSQFNIGASRTLEKADEARFNNANRPIEWIQAEYNNQYSPGTFATKGDAEPGTTAPTVTIAGNLTNSAGTLDLSGSTINLGGNFNSTGGTLTAGTSTVTLNSSSAGQTLTSASQSLYNLTVTNSHASGVTFADSLTLSAGGRFTDSTPSSKLTFADGATFNFPLITINGSGAGDVTMTKGAGAVGHWHFIVPGTPTVTYITVDNSDATGSGAQIDATSHCTDGTGNTYWNFGNVSPVNDSLTFTNPYSSNVAVADDTTSWNFQAKITDADGPTNINYIEIRFANAADATLPYDSLKYRYTEATDAFSEVADTQAAGTITSVSGDATAAGNQWTVNFKIKLNNNFLNKDTNYNVELYSIDDSAASDDDDYANKYQVTTLSISLDTNSPTMAFGNLLPGSVITGTTITTVTSNYPNGYSLSVHDGVAGTNSALLHTDTTTRIADYAGTIATPTVWSGTGLGICVYIATGKDTGKWGAGVSETDVLNKYAGVPENADIIHSKTGSPTSANTSSIGYKLVVPNTQKTGNYSGNVTYTATGVLN